MSLHVMHGHGRAGPGCPPGPPAWAGCATEGEATATHRAAATGTKSPHSTLFQLFHLRRLRGQTTAAPPPHIGFGVSITPPHALQQLRFCWLRLAMAPEGSAALTYVSKDAKLSRARTETPSSRLDHTLRAKPRMPRLVSTDWMLNNAPPCHSVHRDVPSHLWSTPAVGNPLPHFFVGPSPHISINGASLCAPNTSDHPSAPVPMRAATSSTLR